MREGGHAFTDVVQCSGNHFSCVYVFHTLFYLSDLLVNTLGPTWTMQAVLPSLLRRGGGQIVNVSSVRWCIRVYMNENSARTSMYYDTLITPLTEVYVVFSNVPHHLLHQSIGNSYGCRLSAYAASKAALIATHQSLRLELAQAHRRGEGEAVHTLLVLPWMIDTDMFAGASLPWFVRVCFPVLRAGDVAAAVVAGVKSQATELHLPYVLSWMVVVLFAAPVSVRDWLVGVSGGHRGMDGLDQTRKKRL